MMVKRYDQVCSDKWGHFMEEELDGDYVLHTDYRKEVDKLQSQLKASEDRVKELEEMFMVVVSGKVNK